MIDDFIRLMGLTNIPEVCYPLCFALCGVLSLQLVNTIVGALLDLVGWRR